MEDRTTRGAFALLLLLAACGPNVPRQQAPPGWELVWADEFDGETLDRDSWNVVLMPDPFNEELQYYTDRADADPGANVWVEDGVLVIEAREESYEHRDYTSARIDTKDKREFLYGRFAARIRQPAEVGMWPAFWLLGSNIDEVGWPACGEIDVMEGKGRLPSWTSGALHAGPSPEANRILVSEHVLSMGDFHTEWHIFAVVWEPREIRWAVDGVTFHRVRKRPEDDPAYWPFDDGHPFFLIINLAVGGWFDAGYPPPPSLQPQRLYVDWVRVYRSARGADNPPPAPSTDGEPSDAGRQPSPARNRQSGALAAPMPLPVPPSGTEIEFEIERERAP